MSKRTLSKDIPAALSQDIREGSLTITIRMDKDVTLTEDEKAAIPESEHDRCEHTRMVVKAEIVAGKLTTKDAAEASPEKYLSNGIVVGILDAIRVGLVSRRGINIEDAIEDATQRAESAIEVISQVSTLEEVALKLRLAMGETEGNA